MAMSQGSALKSDPSLPVPVNVSAHWGFGEGFRFQYDGKTSQADWAKRKYHSANDSSATGRFYQQQKQHQKKQSHARPLPELVAYPSIHRETDLGVYDRLVFAIEMSIRYHSRRHAHYEHVFRLMMVSIIGLSAFAFVAAPSSRVVLGLCIIGLALGTFVWNITHSSRLHDVIRGEYQSLLENIRLYTHPTDEDIRHWRNQRLRIRAKEPPLFWAVADDCYLETASRWDIEPEPRETLPILLRPFKNWFRI